VVVAFTHPFEKQRAAESYGAMAHVTNMIFFIMFPVGYDTNLSMSFVTMKHF